jgi:uncharacterized protein (DUF885 family)
MQSRALVREFCWMLVLCLTALWAAGARADEGQRLADIAERYFEDKLQLDPLEASGLTGEARFEGRLAITIAPAHQKKVQALAQRVKRELAALNEQSLSAADRTTYAVLKREVEQEIEGEQFPGELLPIDQFGGLPVYLAQMGNGQNIQPLKTAKNFDDYLKRLNHLPAWVDQAIANMRAGIKRRVVQPRPLIASGLPAIKALTEASLDKSTFTLALRNMPADLTAADRARITRAYRESATQRLIPAARKLYQFLEREYLPRTRETAGINALPNGAAWYAFRVKNETTTDLTPEEIHSLGLKEVARIRSEIDKIRVGYKFDGTVTEFLKWHDSDAQFRPFKTEQEVLDAYAALNKKVTEKLPALFGRLPKAPLEIRPEPELTRATASDHYVQPAADGSRSGVFYAVIEDAKKYRSTGMTTLLLHEGQPGHHFHIALQQELLLPRFRKHGWITAYGEGWALYAETLGREMGLYDDPNAYLGHLKDELLRAVRLVTDTGLHAKGWTRVETMQYMMDTEGVSEDDARRATERYMAWPAQALAYKVGAMKIQSLRERAARELGAKFSLKNFHDLVLSNGVLPLSVLESKVEQWMNAQKETNPAAAK